MLLWWRKLCCVFLPLVPVFLLCTFDDARGLNITCSTVSNAYDANPSLVLPFFVNLATIILSSSASASTAVFVRKHFVGIM